MSTLDAVPGTNGALSASCATYETTNLLGSKAAYAWVGTGGSCACRLRPGEARPCRSIARTDRPTVRLRVLSSRLLQIDVVDAAASAAMERSRQHIASGGVEPKEIMARRPSAQTLDVLTRIPASVVGMRLPLAARPSGVD